MKSIQVIPFWLALYSLVSCSAISYRSKGKIPVSFEHRPKHERAVEFEGEKDFYLWGLFPREHIVRVDEEAINQGYKSLAKVMIEERPTSWDVFISVVSLGFYLPKRYLISAYTFEDINK